MVAVFAAVSIAVVIRSDHLARPLGFSVAAAWLLYEPVLVAFAGGTIGHRRCNLRIVDDRTGANVSFLKAVLRTLIKAALGWVSFVSMLTTRRSQAIHDLLTRSTVQIRDLSQAGEHHYVRERMDHANPALPSRTRRGLVILGYLAVAARRMLARAARSDRGRRVLERLSGCRAVLPSGGLPFVRARWRVLCHLRGLDRARMARPAPRGARPLMGRASSLPRARRRAASCRSVRCRAGSPPRTRPACWSRSRAPVWSAGRRRRATASRA